VAYEDRSTYSIDIIGIVNYTQFNNLLDELFGPTHNLERSEEMQPGIPNIYRVTLNATGEEAEELRIASALGGALSEWESHMRDGESCWNGCTATA